MPLHFLPITSGERVDEGSLQELAVASKLEYARNRWLDELVDKPCSEPKLSAQHRLNGALLGLIHSRYSLVLDGPVAAPFFSILSDLMLATGCLWCSTVRGTETLPLPWTSKNTPSTPGCGTVQYALR